MSRLRYHYDGFLVYNTGHKVGSLQMAHVGKLLYEESVNIIKRKNKKGGQVT